MIPFVWFDGAEDFDYGEWPQPIEPNRPVDRPGGSVGDLVQFINNDGCTLDGIILEVDDEGDRADLIVQPGIRWQEARNYTLPDVKQFHPLVVYGVPRATMLYAESWSWKHRKDEPESIYQAERLVDAGLALLP